MFVWGVNGLSGRLYHKDEVPEHFHESYIVKGYRCPRSSPFQCVLSLFDATNETLNFWTHFLPSWYFIWVLKGLSDTLDFRNDSYTWPLLAYMCMIIIYPLASSTAHTFNTMSDYARHICFFLDYSAIAGTALSSGIAYRAYSFPADLRFTAASDLFFNIIGICPFLTIAFACETRFMPPVHLRKVIRLSALGLPCIFVTLPVMYRLVYGTPSELELRSTYHHTLGIALMYLSGLIYGMHFPERLFPGSFDIIGHSHQLFHVCTIFGTMEQMQGFLLDMQERKAELQTNWEFHSIMSSVGLVACVLFINTLIVLLFVYKLYKIQTVKSA